MHFDIDVLLPTLPLQYYSVERSDYVTTVWATGYMGLPTFECGRGVEDDMFLSDHPERRIAGVRRLRTVMDAWPDHPPLPTVLANPAMLDSSEPKVLEAYIRYFHTRKQRLPTVPLRRPLTVPIVVYE
ncbi:hypothetical protein BV25DRAFT_1919195 [Artomyces pyxidatus]|uniref:Uncharacterized protein n=1 Tax=Artomyces pyxidatus TaxID=48021 RepID=A0ACB8SQJ6_9AGAM|nr:hypothetical protein BV25DRAFT_1919195 [Artomyces pyxidatus]